MKVLLTLLLPLTIGCGIEHPQPKQHKIVSKVGLAVKREFTVEHPSTGGPGVFITRDYHWDPDFSSSLGANVTTTKPTAASTACTPIGEPDPDGDADDNDCSGEDSGDPN